jgi:hypothetical protein
MSPRRDLRVITASVRESLETRCPEVNPSVTTGKDVGSSPARALGSVTAIGRADTPSPRRVLQDHGYCASLSSIWSGRVCRAADNSRRRVTCQRRTADGGYDTCGSFGDDVTYRARSDEHQQQRDHERDRPHASTSSVPATTLATVLMQRLPRQSSWVDSPSFSLHARSPGVGSSGCSTRCLRQGFTVLLTRGRE